MGQYIAIFHDESVRVVDVDWSTAHSSMLLTAHGNTEVCLWDLEGSASPVQAFSFDRARSVRWGAYDSEKLFVVAGAGPACVIDARTNVQINLGLDGELHNTVHEHVVADWSCRGNDILTLDIVSVFGCDAHLFLNSCVQDGRLCLWDIRLLSKPRASSVMEQANFDHAYLNRAGGSTWLCTTTSRGIDGGTQFFACVSGDSFSCETLIPKIMDDIIGIGVSRQSTGWSRASDISDGIDELQNCVFVSAACMCAVVPIRTSRKTPTPRLATSLSNIALTVNPRFDFASTRLEAWQYDYSTATAGDDEISASTHTTSLWQEVLNLDDMARNQTLRGLCVEQFDAQARQVTLTLNLNEMNPPGILAKDESGQDRTINADNHSDVSLIVALPQNYPSGPYHLTIRKGVLGELSSESLHRHLSAVVRQEGGSPYVETIGFKFHKWVFENIVNPSLQSQVVEENDPELQPSQLTTHSGPSMEGTVIEPVAHRVPCPRSCAALFSGPRDLVYFNCSVKLPRLANAANTVRSESLPPRLHVNARDISGSQGFRRREKHPRTYAEYLLRLREEGESSTILRQASARSIISSSPNLPSDLRSPSDATNESLNDDDISMSETDLFNISDQPASAIDMPDGELSPDRMANTTQDYNGLYFDTPGRLLPISHPQHNFSLDYAEDDDRSTTADDAHVDRTPTFGAEQSQSQDFGLRNWAHTGSQVYVQRPMPFKRVYITPSNEAENSKAEEFTSVIAPKPTLRKVPSDTDIVSGLTPYKSLTTQRNAFRKHYVQQQQQQHSISCDQLSSLGTPKYYSFYSRSLLPAHAQSTQSLVSLPSIEARVDRTPSPIRPPPPPAHSLVSTPPEERAHLPLPVRMTFCNVRILGERVPYSVIHSPRKHSTAHSLPFPAPGNHGSLERGEIFFPLSSEGDTCRHNARVALQNKQFHVLRIWSILAVTLDAMAEDARLRGMGDSLHALQTPYKESPLGVSLINEIISELERVGDIQTLALIVCVLGGSKATADLGGSRSVLVYDRFLLGYAHMLMRWNRLIACTEVMKHVHAVVEQNPQSGDATMCVRITCQTCGEQSRSMWCKGCKDFAFKCAICCIAVRGTSLFCISCGHGGHPKHIEQWFDVGHFNVAQKKCPTGCGCHCSELAELAPSRAGAVGSKRPSYYPNIASDEASDAQLASVRDPPRRFKVHFEETAVSS